MRIINKHGLTRYIPEDIRRQVRIRDGFGCILCATPILNYEHVDPVFPDAKEHNPDAITLLCPTCHTKVTGKEISKDLVKEAMKNPAAKRLGNIGDTLYFCDTHPQIVFGGATFSNCSVPVHLMGEDVISITQEDGKFLLNAKFWDSQGRQTLCISKNEWIISAKDIWDFKKVANRFIVKEHKKRTALIVEILDNKILKIKRFDMFINGRFRVRGNENELNINGANFKGFDLDGFQYGIYIDKPKPK